MNTPNEILTFAVEALEAALPHYAQIACEAELELEAVAELRNRLVLAAKRAEQDHNRLVRARKNYNEEIEKIAKYGRKAADLAAATVPLEMPMPAAVRLAVKGRPAIEHAVRSAATYVSSAAQVCGVYFLLNEEDIVYVGQSVNVFSRVLSHGQDPTKEFTRACWVPVPRDELDGVEDALIALLKPKHNTRGVNKLGDDSLSLFCGEPCWP